MDEVINMIEKKEKSMDNLLLLGIIGLVAIVAILAMTMGTTKKITTESTNSLLGTDNSIIGQAYYPYYNSTYDKYVSNPRDLKGNGILQYNRWSSYPYADGYCVIVEGCEGASNIRLVEDGQYSCRCDSRYWGCEGKSCTYARGSWSRIESLVCTGCLPQNNSCVPSEEVCDGIDNDCDGSIDEHLTQKTTCGLGVCAGNTGFETCMNGTWFRDTCNPLLGSMNETCDGIDNDCDGSIDEGCPSNKTAIYVANVTDFRGNGVLQYNYWTSSHSYPYATGFCQLRMNCEAATNVTLVADGQYSCRCDSGYWGCEGKSCTTAQGSWSRIASVVCTGC